MRDVLFVQETMDIQEITESVDIADGMEATTISLCFREKRGKIKCLKSEQALR